MQFIKYFIVLIYICLCTATSLYSTSASLCLTIYVPHASFCPTILVPQHLCVLLPLSFSVTVSHFLCPSASLCLTIFVLKHHFVSLSLFFSITVSHYLCSSASLCLTIFVLRHHCVSYPGNSLHQFVSIFLSLRIFVSHNLFPSNLCVSHSLCETKMLRNKDRLCVIPSLTHYIFVSHIFPSLYMFMYLRFNIFMSHNLYPSAYS